MRSRPTTQWGRRLIRKHQKWVRPPEAGAGARRGMEDRGTNHDTDSDYHPVTFHSWTFKDAETNYNVHDKELMAIYDAFKRWRHYLEGAGTVRVRPHLRLAVPIFVRPSPSSSDRTTHIVRSVRPDPPDLTGFRLILFMHSRMFSFHNRTSFHVLSSSTFYLRLNPRSSILISVTYPRLSDSSSH